jgi:hypothetical protein
MLSVSCHDTTKEINSTVVVSEKQSPLFTSGTHLVYTEFDSAGVEYDRETWEVKVLNNSTDSVSAESVVYYESMLNDELKEYNSGYYLKDYTETNNGISFDLDGYMIYPLSVKKRSDLPGGKNYIIHDSKLFYPKTMASGQKLSDATITVISKDTTERIPPTKILNRTVLALDSCKTRAGTWNCYKISYDVQSIGPVSGKVLFSSHVTEWFNFEVGVVRRETYNGTKVFRTELTQISKS